VHEAADVVGEFLDRIEDLSAVVEAGGGFEQAIALMPLAAGKMSICSRM